MESQISLFGRTLSEHSALTKEKTSEPCLKKSAKSKIKQYLYLDLESGLTPEKSWEMRSPLRGEFTTLNISESPRPAEEYTLSQTLMTEVPEKYNLSEKACKGILRRCESRGATIHPELLELLMSPAEKPQKVEKFQALEHHPHDSRIKIKSGDISQTLSAQMGTGGGNIPLVMCYSVGSQNSNKMTVKETNISRTITHDCCNPASKQGGIIVCDYASYNQGKNAGFKPRVLKTETSPTLVARGPSVCYIKFLRKYTPTECARLQGMPDWWCDGARANNTDTAEYKMWGNGMALPCMMYILGNVLEVVNDRRNKYEET